MSRREAPAALRWTVYVAVAVVFAIACAVLSHWQFSRNEERNAQLELIAANYDATPQALGDVLPAGAELDPADEWTQVALTGEYLTDQQLLVRNRAHGGTSAFEVLVPFRTAEGRILMIDRGWVPPGEDRHEPDAVPAAPAGEVDVVARLRPSEQAPAANRTEVDGQVATIHLPLVAEQLADPGALDTGAYGRMVSEDPAPATAPGEIASPSDDPGPHLSYAIQWILFAVMGFGFIAYVIVTERRHRREEAEEAATAAATGVPLAREAPAVAAHRRRQRHRDRDGEEEDALLDAR